MIKSIALLTPLYVTLFWSLVFLIRPNLAGKAKSTLGIFMLMATFLYSSHNLYFHKQYHLYSFFESVYIFTSLMLYPLFYQYVIELSSRNLDARKKYLQYLPAILLSGISLFLTLIISTEERIFYVKMILIENNLNYFNYDSIVDAKSGVFVLSRVLFVIQTFFYLALGIRSTNKYNKKISNYYSDTYGRKINWVKDISIILIVLSAAGVVFTLIGRSYFAKHEFLLFIPSLLFSYIFFEIGFKGNLQQQVSVDLMDEQDTNNVEHIKAEEEKNLNTRLVQLFEEEKIYQLSDLRITTVSQKLDTNRTYISKLINDEFEMNFNEFVNKYRLEEAKQLLSSTTNHHYTMEYIAEKSGFGSAASFSRCFKELEGITPGKYREKNM